MEMDDELENFIRERKTRVAEDKASLGLESPYMEIQVKPQRACGSTVKENIPPKCIVQGKEEINSVGLPLGVEYEKKKKRLQHELRMDYRRYMAQRNHLDTVDPGPLHHPNNRKCVKNLLEHQAGDVLQQRPPSRRDAATLTEGSCGLHRVLRLTEGKTRCPEEDEEQSLILPRHHDMRGRTVDQESKEEENSIEELALELMEGSRHRYNNKADGRDKRIIPLGFASESRRSRALTKHDDAEFSTGLIIGVADTNEALQRRKEHYRKELQEQIAEKHRNKKREKDLELKFAALGASDPEKQPDRIRQFGLSRRKDLQVLEPSATAESESSSRGRGNSEKPCVGRWTSPTDQPHVAFQSPLLEFSSALGLLGGGLSPSGQPPALGLPRTVDTRIPYLPPHPPSTVSEAYRGPYGDQYYYTRNLLDPNMAYYGHSSVPSAGLPVSFWNVPPGGAVPSQFGDRSPHSQHSGSSFPEPPTQPSSDAAPTDSRTELFHPERSRSTRERILSYRDALKQQIQEQQERRRLEREERERYEAQLEADMKNHQPWGRGGGGAPLKDCTGNLIADLNQMHKLNEEAYSNPEEWQRRTTAAKAARRADLPDPNERVCGFTHVQSPQYARGNVFANQPTQQQLQEQEKYNAFLKQQIEEKLRNKAEERERTRLEEEKEEKRLEEQRARIQQEYEEEQGRKKRKEMEQKAKNEELIQLAEQRKKEVERKKKEEEEKENAALTRQYERKRQVRMEEVHREPSPPIPALQKKHGVRQYTPRPPTVESQRSTAAPSERSLSGLQSPPVPACRNQLRAAGDQRDVLSELSALRRQLRSEQKRLEGNLQQDYWEELDSPLSDRQSERPLVDVFDMARLRLQAPVRRPHSTNMEPRNLLRIHDSLQLNYTDGESRLGCSDVLKLGNASRKRQDYMDPYHQLSSQRSTVQDDYFDLPPPHQNEYLRSAMGGSARCSLLESESAFIAPLGDFPVPRSPELENPPRLSARERRRLAKQPQHPQEQATSSEHIGEHPAHTTGSGLHQGAESSSEERRRNRTRRLMTLSRRGNSAGPVHLSDDESSTSQFSSHNLNHRSSVETVSTDPWLRPGTSETMKCLDRPLRRERLIT